MRYARSMGFHRNQRPAARGFNIIELMITVMIVAILTALALPNFVQFLRRMQVSGVKNDLISDVNFAKAEAAKRGYPVGIYSLSGSTDWSTGWAVWADSNLDGLITGADTMLRQHPGLTSGYMLLSSGPTGNNAPLLFNAQGNVQLPVVVPVYFTVCNPDHVAADARSIQVNAPGSILGVNGIPAASGVICP